MSLQDDEAFALLTAIVIQDMVNSSSVEKTFTINIPDHLDTQHFSIGIIERNAKEIKIHAMLKKGTHEPESTRNVPKGYH